MKPHNSILIFVCMVFGPVLGQHTYETLSSLANAKQNLVGNVIHSKQNFISNTINNKQKLVSDIVNNKRDFISSVAHAKANLFHSRPQQIWKIHKYSGVELKPVSASDAEHLNLVSSHHQSHQHAPAAIKFQAPVVATPAETYGPPPSPADIYGPPASPANVYGPPSNTEGEHINQNAALEALSSLGAALPDDGLNNLPYGQLLHLYNNLSSAKRGVLNYIRHPFRTARSIGAAKAQALQSGYQTVTNAVSRKLGSPSLITDSVTYDNIPIRSLKQHILSYVPFIGRKLNSLTSTHPYISGYGKVPATPNLPYISIPGKFKLRTSKNPGYLSIKTPHHQAPVAPISSYGPPSAPLTSYGVPEVPSTSYGVLEVPSTSYGSPSSSSYSSASSSAPSTSYGSPSSSYSSASSSAQSSSFVPSTSHTVPTSSFSSASSSSSSSYSPLHVPQSISYSAPAAPSSSYGVPSSSYEAPSNSYNAPSAPASYSEPSTSYSAPAAPFTSYSAPSSSYAAQPISYEAPSTSYETPSISYSPPSAPSYSSDYQGVPQYVNSYQGQNTLQSEYVNSASGNIINVPATADSGSQFYSFPSHSDYLNHFAQQQAYNPDASFAASENDEQWVQANPSDKEYQSNKNDEEVYSAASAIEYRTQPLQDDKKVVKTTPSTSQNSQSENQASTLKNNKQTTKDTVSVTTARNIRRTTTSAADEITASPKSQEVVTRKPHSALEDLKTHNRSHPAFLRTTTEAVRQSDQEEVNAENLADTKGSSTSTSA